MLYYTEVCLSPCEVPEHKSICIYISGCLNKCAECHYPLLQRMDYGDILYDKFINIDSYPELIDKGIWRKNGKDSSIS